MKIVCAISALLLTVSAATARPVRMLTYQELYTNADLVAVLAVESISVSGTVNTNNPYPGMFSNYVARCRVQWIFKGDQTISTLDVPFSQHPAGKPGFNGAMPAPFTVDRMIDYLVYLKRDEHGRWVAAGGSYDAALSIKQLRLHGNPWELKLPVHGTLTP